MKRIDLKADHDASENYYKLIYNNAFTFIISENKISFVVTEYGAVVISATSEAESTFVTRQGENRKTKRVQLLLLPLKRAVEETHSYT